MKPYARVDANIDSHPKIIQAGAAGSEVYRFLLRINRREQLDGVIPARYAEPSYVARMLQWYGDPDIKDPVARVKRGVTDCVTSDLLSTSRGDSLVIVGYTKEWSGPSSSAERVRKYRESRSGVTRCNEHETQCNGSVTVTARTEQNRTEQNKDRKGDNSVESSPAPSSESKSKKKPRRPVIEPAEAAIVELLYDRFEAWTGVRYLLRRGGKLTVNTEGVVRRLRGGYTDQDLRLVLQHRGYLWADDPETKRWMRPETIFRPSKLDGYLAEARAWEKENAETTTRAGRADSGGVQPVRDDDGGCDDADPLLAVLRRAQGASGPADPQGAPS